MKRKRNILNKRTVFKALLRRPHLCVPMMIGTLIGSVATTKAMFNGICQNKKNRRALFKALIRRPQRGLPLVKVLLSGCVAAAKVQFHIAYGINSYGMNSDYGERDPQGMPDYFWGRSTHLDYDSAIKADIKRQRYTAIPRYWYVDASISCEHCEKTFCFTAREQQAWYEEYGFDLASFPKHCLACRKELRQLKSLRQEYDNNVTNTITHDDIAAKKHMLSVIDRLEEVLQDLPRGIRENKNRLANQISQSPT